MPLVVRPMQAVIASPRRAPRSDSAAHAFLLSQTCLTRRLTLTADAGGAKGAGGRSELANRAVSLRRCLNAVRQTRHPRRWDVQSASGAVAPLAILALRLRGDCADAVPRGASVDMGETEGWGCLRSRFDRHRRKRTWSCRPKRCCTASTGQPCCLEKLPSATPRILWPMLDLATVRRLGVVVTVSLTLALCTLVTSRSTPTIASSSRSLRLGNVAARMVLYNLRAAAVTATSASVPNSRPWTQTPLLTVAGIAAPVQLPETPYAYVAASSSVAGSSPAERLVRIDLADGQVTKGPALVSGSFLLAIGRQIGVLSPARYSARKGPSGPETVRLVQGSSMTLGRGVVVPAPYLDWQTTLVNPALANHGLWYQVGSGKEIALVDTLTGAVLRSMRFPSTVMSVASSPDGRFVYVTFDGPDPRTKPPMIAIVVEELDASSLKVLARQYIDAELAALATAVPGGVWVANSGGMQWSEFLYLSPKLSQVVRKPLFPFPTGTVPTLDGVVTQGDSAQVFGRSVFLVGSAGASCDNPSTGRFIAGASFPELGGGGFESWGLFAAWHSLLYGVRFAASALSFEILRIQPPKACRA
jgi:hypothetical protein